MARRSLRYLSCALAAAACLPAGAAELGDARVASHTGQPLVADIELTMLEDPATPVSVRLASPEVYSGAGIAVPALLSSLNLTVMRRDGRQFLHVTSLRPFDADHLHLYLELADKGQRAVRLATLWLTPDPNPAPAALPVPMPLPVQVPVPVPVPVPVKVPARLPVPVPAPETAPVRTRVAAPVPAPAERAPAAVAARLPHPLPAIKPALPAPADAHPSACMRQPDEAQACTALGARNADLRAQLGRLEDKVKGLQATLGVKPAALPAQLPAKLHPVPPAAVPAPAAARAEAVEPAAQETRPAPPTPKPIHSIKPLVPHKPKAPTEDDSLPWGWIGAGAGLLALAGAGAAFVAARRNQARRAGVADEPGIIARLKRRLAARRAAAPAADPVQAEPTLE